MNIINGLHAHPDMLEGTETFLEEAIAAKLKKEQRNDETFDSVSTFAALEPQWMKHWVSMRSNISVERLDLAKRKNEQAIIQIFLHMINCAANLKVPAACLCAEVLMRLCDRLWKHFGSRLGVVRGTPLISEEGVVDWSLFCYAADKVEEGTLRLISVKHIPTGDVAVVDGDITIKWDSSWQLKANWSESMAHMTNGKKAQHSMLIQAL